jgi:hypothetical protein
MPFLGEMARDQITGFQGRITGYVEYLTGCHQILIVPRMKDDGTLVPGEWFDTQRVELLPEFDTLKLGTINPGRDREPPKR